jgi:hypothetical protein
LPSSLSEKDDVEIEEDKTEDKKVHLTKSQKRKLYKNMDANGEKKEDGIGLILYHM